MSANTFVSYAILALEALVGFCVCLAFMKRSHRRYAVEETEADDTAAHGTTLPRSSSSTAPATAGDAAAATVLYTAATARHRRSQANFASYFPAAELRQAVVDGSVVAEVKGVREEAEAQKDSDKDAPYGKATYIHRPRSTASK
ncbi:hypothetical protein ABB37_05895 [Leptomonas pyrrhocoris]|uniref:Uncharacterized protein n=1 Tax=Leptomonas pyrrhocoris TaxID=157538 RepID=A0A0M9FZ28_LEPPY|nr:hypothetical protein ABB37_05895 [Leptomonas pyrrhocoris]KPA78796.1 hypothetical protein ABB37_05895 [Leptomonas pyrrhocoris]|eukprot:XP_015657235.1 hypothetical protein ABB37_05895 [Leptomonas pyrrhocoris]